MIKCQSVLIKFMEISAPQQEIRALQVTGCKYIEAVIKDRFLVLMLFSTSKQPLKMISFNLEDIKEYACEGIIWEI